MCGGLLDGAHTTGCSELSGEARVLQGGAWVPPPTHYLNIQVSDLHPDEAKNSPRLQKNKSRLSKDAAELCYYTESGDNTTCCGF